MQSQFRQGAYAGHPNQQVQQRTPQRNQQRGGMGTMVPGPPQHGAVNRAGMQQPAPHPPPHEISDATYMEKAKKRRDRKPNDKNIPEGVENCVVDADVAQRYRELRELERRLDAIMTRKRLDLIETVSRDTKRWRTLRIWISNTAEGQPWQGTGMTGDSFELSSSMNSSYRVKIEARLLDDKDDVSLDTQPNDEAWSHDASEDSSSSSQEYRFSHFFKRMTVDFNKGYSTDGSSIAWTRPDAKSQGANNSTASDFDELTFKRNGDENQNITVNLYRREEPERQQLSPELADIVDKTEATPQEAMLAVWEYIRLLGLQDDEEKRNFRCDDLLRRVIPAEGGRIPELEQYIAPHLTEMAPISLPYTIRVDEEFHKNPQPTIYDVQVAFDDPLRSKAIPLLSNATYGIHALNEIRELDARLVTLIGAVANSKAKHSFFNSLSQDPVPYMRDWLSSQKRDLEVIMGEAPRGGGEDATSDEWRRGGKDSVWATSNARESVTTMLTRGMR